MFDPLSTQFSAIQKEAQAGKIGDPADERQTYAALYGDDLPPRPFSRRRAAVVVALRVVLALIGLLALLTVLV